MSWQNPDILSAAIFIRKLPLLERFEYLEFKQGYRHARSSQPNTSKHFRIELGRAIAGSQRFEKVLPNSAGFFETGCRDM